MPIRNGKIVDWTHKIDEFSTIVCDENFSVKEKLEKLHALMRRHHAIFNKDEDEYADQIEEAIEDWGHDEEELEFVGDGILNSIYNYADEHLIWLGIS